MFGKPLQCSICYKTSPRDHGLTFKHKVDTDCGNGWFCTSRQRIHVCNDCSGRSKSCLMFATDDGSKPAEIWRNSDLP